MLRSAGATQTAILLMTKGTGRGTARCQPPGDRFVALRAGDGRGSASGLPMVAYDDDTCGYVRTRVPKGRQQDPSRT